MFSAFFGHYLLNKGIVTRDQLTQVLETQKTTRLKLGILAINSKYMTSSEVDKVHQLQETIDRRFGEIAIMKGYLSDEQLSDLLNQQKSEHLILAQALIDEGIMDLAKFEEEITLYKLAYGLDDEQFDAIKKGDIRVVMTAFLAFEKSGMSEFYIDFVTLFVKNIIRFIDTNVYVDRVEKVDSIIYKHLFTQKISGAAKIFTAYSGDDKAILDIASQNAGEVFDKFGDYPLDSACEFLNMANGLFIVNQSDEGVDLSLGIQKYVENASIKPNEPMYRIPIHISTGTIYLHVGVS